MGEHSSPNANPTGEMAAKKHKMHKKINEFGTFA
jgi:hypothetical protein